MTCFQLAVFDETLNFGIKAQQAQCLADGRLGNTEQFRQLFLSQSEFLAQPPQRTSFLNRVQLPAQQIFHERNGSSSAIVCLSDHGGDPLQASLLRCLPAHVSGQNFEAAIGQRSDHQRFDHPELTDTLRQFG